MTPNARTHTPARVAIVALRAAQHPCFGPIPPRRPR